MRAFLLFLSLLFPLCANGEVVMLGKPRPAISPEMVKIYAEPPATFEQIALIGATSKKSFRFSAQGKMDKVIERLKEQAARLGANGVILQSVGDRYAGSVNTATGTVSGSTAYGSGVSVPITGKMGQGIAIYVPPDTPNSKDATR